MAQHCNQWGLYGIRVRQRRDVALVPSYFGQTCSAGSAATYSGCGWIYYWFSLQFTPVSDGEKIVKIG